MSRFQDIKQTSAKFKQALRAMQELLQEEEGQSVQDVYAEVIHEYAKQQFMEGHHVKESSVVERCLCRVLGKRCPWKAGKYGSCITFGAIDHPSLFNRDGKPAIFVSQPYGLTVDQMRSIVSVSDEYGLDVQVHGHSWHYPDSTLLIEVTKRTEK